MLYKLSLQEREQGEIIRIVSDVIMQSLAFAHPNLPNVYMTSETI